MKFLVTNIEYDTDGEKVDLPTELEIEVDEDITDYNEQLDFISDEISNKTGFCHFGFVVSPIK